MDGEYYCLDQLEIVLNLVGHVHLWCSHSKLNKFVVSQVGAAFLLFLLLVVLTIAVIHHWASHNFYLTRMEVFLICLAAFVLALAAFLIGLLAGRCTLDWDCLKHILDTLLISKYYLHLDAYKDILWIVYVILVQDCLFLAPTNSLEPLQMSLLLEHLLDILPSWASWLDDLLQ